ncbi:MAG: ABC transporter permease [Bifidobacteriaceae bacterium]|nr:ABC transporter permease [Bifidobacteriaceae bacterium]
MIAAIDQGLVYALLALGVFLTYRILNIADLTVDGSFATGGGICAILIYNGVDPFLATAAAFAAGALAGMITGLLHTKLKIDPLLASILTMIALYSINLRIMGSPNVGLNLKDGQPITTVFSGLRRSGLLNSWQSLCILLGVALVFTGLIVWFLSTNFGLAVQATGDNPGMAMASGISTDWTKTITLMLANGLVGLSGGLYAQFQGFADVQMGIGLILVGLASVIVGNAILGTRYMVLAALGVVVGSVIYRLVLFFAIDWHLAQSGDMKLISSVMVVIALVLSQNAAVRGVFARVAAARSRVLGSVAEAWRQGVRALARGLIGSKPGPAGHQAKAGVVRRWLGRLASMPSPEPRPSPEPLTSPELRPVPDAKTNPESAASPDTGPGDQESPSGPAGQTGGANYAAPD